MRDINTVVISGRITQEISLRTTPSGLSVCDVDVASNRFGKNKEQITTFTRTTLWDKQAEWAAENLSVGDTVVVQGQLEDNNFEKDGQKTSGRLKIGDANLQLMKKKLKKVDSKLSDDMTPPVV